MSRILTICGFALFLASACRENVRALPIGAPRDNIAGPDLGGARAQPTPGRGPSLCQYTKAKLGACDQFNGRWFNFKRDDLFDIQIEQKNCEKARLVSGLNLGNADIELDINGKSHVLESQDGQKYFLGFCSPGIFGTEAEIVMRPMQDYDKLAERFDDLHLGSHYSLHTEYAIFRDTPSRALSIGLRIDGVHAWFASEWYRFDLNAPSHAVISNCRGDLKPGDPFVSTDQWGNIGTREYQLDNIIYFDGVPLIYQGKGYGGYLIDSQNVHALNREIHCHAKNCVGDKVYVSAYGRDGYPGIFKVRIDGFYGCGDYFRGIVVRESPNGSAGDVLPLRFRNISLMQE